jgi:hypothetical protein
MVKIADVAYPYQKAAKRVERLFSYMERYGGCTEREFVSQMDAAL